MVGWGGVGWEEEKNGPGVWAVLVSSWSLGITRTPVCFQASSGGDVGGDVMVGSDIVYGVLRSFIYLRLGLELP